MRVIPIEKWKAINAEGKEIEESLLSVLNVLLSNKKPEEMPRGLDKFRLFSRLSKTFDEAEKTHLLKLEEFDYNFLKSSIEKDIPCVWGGNINISQAIEEFMNAKETFNV